MVKFPRLFLGGEREIEKELKKCLAWSNKNEEREKYCVSHSIQVSYPSFLFRKAERGKMFHLPFFSDGNRPNSPPPHSYLGGGRKRKKRKWGKNKHVLPSLYPLFFPVSSSLQGKFPNLAKLTPLRNPPPLEKEKRRKLFSFPFLRLGDLWCRRPRKEKINSFFFTGQKIILDNGRRDVDGNSFSEAQVMAQSHIWLWKEEKGKKRWCLRERMRRRRRGRNSRVTSCRSPSFFSSLLCGSRFTNFLGAFVKK